ncbi:hypothetical protein GCM10020000_72620 [Streptomyces olivoverticillatus]
MARKCAISATTDSPERIRYLRPIVSTPQKEQLYGQLRLELMARGRQQCAARGVEIRQRRISGVGDEGEVGEREGVEVVEEGGVGVDADPARRQPHGGAGDVRPDRLARGLAVVAGEVEHGPLALAPDHGVDVRALAHDAVVHGGGVRPA